MPRQFAPRQYRRHESHAPAFDQAIRSHDDLLKRRDLAIWVGAEPTFTDRRSEAPEWLCNALGPSKEAPRPADAGRSA
ncbi:MAG: hypothetical protein MZV65_41285 [Chromatiales bacterium]|nr:hypothetical protein [Chromatiales bacterium]